MSTLCNIHSTHADYEQIAQFYDEHKDVLFDDIPLSLLQWFDANMAAPLGAVLDLLEDDLNAIVFNHIDDNIKNILQKNGFLSHFGFAQQIDVHGTTIQYQKMKPKDGRYFREYVAAQFLQRHELPNMSNGLHKKMIEAMLELFVNAQIHSETKHIYTCGQFFPARQTIAFSIVDTGIGFTEQFRRRFSKKISAVDAIRWSVEDRHTTKLNIPGGIGLALLREFVNLNKGLLQIVSHDGFYQYDHAGEKTHTLNKPFPGSIVNVLFHTNDRRNYSLLDDNDVSDLF